MLVTDRHQRSYIYGKGWGGVNISIWGLVALL